MKGKWLILILILATAIQQIVAGVSCCCFAAAFFHPEPAALQAQTANSPAARCSKCQPKASRTCASQVRFDRLTKAHSDPCNCPLSIRHLAVENLTPKLEFSRHGHEGCLDASDRSNSPDQWDLLARFSLDKARLTRSSELAPAPEPLGARLSRLSLWVI